MKVITVEDPVEYRLDRITQVQVLPKIGLDFARVLRTALRQDPDILLIGEMRDRETVEIGLRGAMTGHFVFSTLHTINAIASVNRLLDMGAPGYMIAAAVHGVIAQRLVRRVCTDCAQPTDAHGATSSPGSRPAGRDLKPEDHRFVAGAGCTYCNLTGYRGRVAVYEILEIDRTLADAVRRGDLEGFAHAARTREDYVPLAQGAIDFALRGVTSLGEAMAVGSGLEEFVEVDEPARKREAEAQLEDDVPLEDSSVEALLEQRG